MKKSKILSTVLVVFLVFSVFATSAFAQTVENKVVNQTIHLGQNYPPASISFNDGSWSGVLSLKGVVDSPYERVDYSPRVEYMTLSETRVTFDYPGPDSIYISSNGYTEYLYRVATGIENTPNGQKRYYTTYSGTVSRTTMVANVTLVHDYTGFYEGVVSRTVQ